jgi:malate dehydrogenase (oxaloacetate-decarboxylating)(NADP+)
VEPLYYHSTPFPGKLTVKTTKAMNNIKDLSLAYSPGVAEPCIEIAQNPEDAYKYTNKGNMVAVISNGTAVLGLGNIGALASKPVMEGKAVLFNKFAGVESIDLCINAPDMYDFVKIVKALGPSFGGINLEDIKGPDCFYIEETLKAEMDIPVFHDD